MNFPVKAIPDLPDFDTFRKQGILNSAIRKGHHVAYKAFATIRRRIR